MERRHRNDDYDDVSMSSPPFKVSKASVLSTPHALSRSSRTSTTQHRHNSVSISVDDATTSSAAFATPVGSSSTTTPPTSSTTTKAYKGLRHFSLMVCKKVEEKGTTSYNEVADELVRKILDERYNTMVENAIANDNGTVPSPQQQPTKFDEKNIRRRVYDALNVLMAMNIISKDKKAIMWKGLPTSLQSASMIFPDGSTVPPTIETYESIQNDIQVRTKSVQRKREMIQELLLQHVCFRNLVERNYHREQQQSPKSAVTSTSQTTTTTINQEHATTALTTSSSSSPSSDITVATTAKEQQLSGSSKSKQQQQQQKKKQLLLDNKIPLPFIVINTNKNAVIQCNMSRDLTDVMFDVTMPFEINDDNSILKRLQLHQTSHEVLRNMLPDHIYQYCVTNHLLDDMILLNQKVSTTTSSDNIMFTKNVLPTLTAEKGPLNTTGMTTAPTTTNVW